MAEASLNATNPAHSPDGQVRPSWIPQLAKPNGEEEKRWAASHGGMECRPRDACIRGVVKRREARIKVRPRQLYAVMNDDPTDFSQWRTDISAQVEKSLKPGVIRGGAVAEARDRVTRKVSRKGASAR